jgi:hypothetical protein
VGAYTLGFDADFKGFKSTSYTATKTAGVTAIGVFVVTEAVSPGLTLAKGTMLTVNMTVKDAVGTALTDATFTADLDGTAVTFAHIGSGVYRTTVNTTSLAVGSYSLNVVVSKSGFTSHTHSFAITLQAQQGAQSDNMILIIAIIAIVAVVAVAVAVLMMHRRGASTRKHSK